MLFLWFIFFVLYFILVGLLIMGVGYVLYYCGAKSVGHWLVSSGYAGMFYKPKWLVNHCPKNRTVDCDKCRRWTCPNFDKKEKN